MRLICYLPSFEDVLFAAMLVLEVFVFELVAVLLALFMFPAPEFVEVVGITDGTVVGMVVGDETTTAFLLPAFVALVALVLAAPPQAEIVIPAAATPKIAIALNFILLVSFVFSKVLTDLVCESFHFHPNKLQMLSSKNKNASQNAKKNNQNINFLIYPVYSRENQPQRMRPRKRKLF
jgi:hypothetical protein